jgi:cytochrome c oxidase subunit 2
MKIFGFRIPFPLVVSGVLAAVILLVPLTPTYTPTVRRIAIDASQFAFTPSRVEVNAGDRIIFTVTSSDVVHGFYLEGYGIERRITPGIAEEIEVVVDRPGKFRIRCSVTCGTMHPFMIGELIVGPNYPLMRAGAAMLVLLGGMVVSVWKSKVPELSGETDDTIQET